VRAEAPLETGPHLPARRDPGDDAADDTGAGAGLVRPAGDRQALDEPLETCVVEVVDRPSPALGQAPTSTTAASTAVASAPLTRPE
jgi:hypothetical protein